MLIKKILINKETNTKHYWSSGDLHTKDGIIKESDIKNGDFARTHLGKGFYVLPALFPDKTERIKRGPAIMLPKDIGLIIAYTGIDAKSKILDAGAGCGMLAAHLALISKSVVSYEINKPFLKLAEENLKALGVKVKLNNKDIYNGIDEHNLDT